MNEALTMPPDLPTPTSSWHNLLGAAAFAVCAVSAAVHAGAFYMASDLARYKASMPPHTLEGGPGFSLAAHVWLVTFIATGFGLLGASLLVTSVVARPDARFSALHVGSLLLLLPFIYTVIRILMLILR